jgi:hypothetical protein
MERPVPMSLPSSVLERAVRVRERVRMGVDGEVHGRCLGCGHEVVGGERFVRLAGGDVVHADCGLYTPRWRRAA